MLEFFIALVGDSVQADKLVRFDYSAKLFPSSKSVCVFFFQNAGSAPDAITGGAMISATP